MSEKKKGPPIEVKGMKCPKCGAEMTYHEGEDEFSGDTLIPYSYWFCGGCGHWINDYEDEFEYPDDGEQAMKGGCDG